MRRGWQPETLAGNRKTWQLLRSNNTHYEKGGTRLGASVSLSSPKKQTSHKTFQVFYLVSKETQIRDRESEIGKRRHLSEVLKKSVTTVETGA